MNASSLEVFKGQVGWSSEEPGLVEGVARELEQDEL